MDKQRKVHITIKNALNYDIVLKKVMIFEGKTSGVATGFVIGARSCWSSVVEQTKFSMSIKGKYFFAINGLLAPLRLSVHFEYLHWKDKRGSIAFYNAADRGVQFGHGNMGEKIGGTITGYTEGSELKLTVHLTSSIERMDKGPI